MSKHTPGPWKVKNDIIYKGENEVIASCEDAKDVCLIAAAPELYETLKLIWDSTAVLNHLDLETLDLISKAIAKAEGE